LVPLTHLEGRSIGVFGLARSGLATVRAAVAGGAADVVVWDDKEEARAEAEAEGGIAIPPEHWPWERLECLVLAPGVPLTHPAPHPIVQLARNAEVEIICDIELLWRETEGRARFVAITGTNGKSTTTALLGHVLAVAGPVSVGGNIGRAALDLEPPGEKRTYVLEMSSYQLDLTRRFRPDVAVWLNLTPDHLARHGDLRGYAKAKARVFVNMRPEDTAVVGIDEPPMNAVAAALKSPNRPKLVTVSVGKNKGATLFVDQTGALTEADGRNGKNGVTFANLPMLRGLHNWQNAAAAWGAAKALGLYGGIILSAMESFPGLAHRMEVIGRHGSVLFVNDSKATNADAAARALVTFEPIYWIAGGQAKEGGITSLTEYFPRIAKAYLIGAAADEFSAVLAGQVPHVIAGDLDTAVKMAAADAALDRRAEPTVLLSPACASFDQFADFEDRGEAFRRSVAALAEAPMEAVA
jgi:UDP-N-acetylmuramoylalanine--D-glutamate ligase